MAVQALVRRCLRCWWSDLDTVLAQELPRPIRQQPGLAAALVILEGPAVRIDKCQRIKPRLRVCVQLETPYMPLPTPTVVVSGPCRIS